MHDRFSDHNDDDDDDSSNDDKASSTAATSNNKTSSSAAAAAAAAASSNDNSFTSKDHYNLKTNTIDPKATPSNPKHNNNLKTHLPSAGSR